MPPKLLNIIIAVSAVGLIVIGGKDLFLSPQKISQTLPSPTLSPTPFVDSEVPCQNAYFNFQKGTTWNYQIDSKTEIGKKQDTKKYSLINTVKEASPSSLLIESQINKEPKKILTLICRQSGLYGFSFPFLPESLSNASSVLATGDSVRFLPNDTLLAPGQTWTDNIGLLLKHTAQSQTQQNILDAGMKNVIEIATTVDMAGLPIEVLGIKQAPSLKYHVAEGIGITDFSFSANFGNDDFVNFDVKLVDFKEGE